MRALGGQIWARPTMSMSTFQNHMRPVEPQGPRVRYIKKVPKPFTCAACIKGNHTTCFSNNCECGKKHLFK